ncbi:MAG: hypothetical protein ACKV0T_18640 [Planctomycetales bacterium]
MPLKPLRTCGATHRAMPGTRASVVCDSPIPRPVVSEDGPNRRGGNARVMVIVVAAALVGSAWYFWPRNKGVAPAEEAGRPVVDAFLSDVREDRVDVAWDSASAEFKSDLGREAFHASVLRHPILKAPLQFASYRPNVTHGITRGEYTFRGEEVPQTVKIMVAREQEQWKVERLIVE